MCGKCSFYSISCRLIMTQENANGLELLGEMRQDLTVLKSQIIVSESSFLWFHLWTIVQYIEMLH